MNKPALRLRRAFLVFYFVLAAVLLVQSATLAFQTSSVHLRLLGAIEALAAALFIFPATLQIGAGALLVCFALAAGLHLAEGQWPGGLLVYAAGTVFVLLHGGPFAKNRHPHPNA